MPSQSELMPYSNRLPGSASSGAAKITFEPDSTFGVPVAVSHRRRSAFQNR
ncbi:MAG TPA: hypothetical protein VLR26_02115 [Frankiaceae bacterium]|nr:hypothetical protein [Frankiaceae bacterium]